MCYPVWWIMHIKEPLLLIGMSSAVAMSSANGLVGTGYRFQPRAGFVKAQWVGVRPLHPLLSH